MTGIPVLPAFPRPAPRPALRTRLRPLARRLSGPLATLGFILLWAAVASLETSPLLPLLPWLLLGVGLFAGGMRASGEGWRGWFF